MSLRFVEKRDGRSVPFDKSKIAGAVARAQHAVGEEDDALAGEVADLVELTLKRRYTPDVATPGIPGIEEIQDLVEQALIELGHARLAKAYILYRDRRARIREVLEVHGDRGRDARLARSSDGSDRSPTGSPVSPATTGDPDESREPRERDDVRVARASSSRRPPRVQLAGAVATWSKGRIVAALMQEADLSRQQAEQVASRVEERVLESGFRRISTALIRELVDNELVEMGLAQALSRQRPVGIPRHDLRALLSRAASTRDLVSESETDRVEAPSVDRAVAGEVLRRYALEDVLPESIAELCLSGEIGVEDLDRPHLPLVRALPAELLISGEPGAQAAFDALAEVGRQASQCAYGVVIEDAASLLQGLVRGARASAAFAASGEIARERRPSRQQGALAHWISSLSAVARTSERRIDLIWRGSSAGAPAAWLARFIEEMDLADRSVAHGLRPRLFVDGAELAEALAEIPLCAPACERLLRIGRLVPTWESDTDQFAGRGLRRVKGERGALSLGAACALNLPRQARRAGPWREDLLLESLAELVAKALDALASLARFQRTTSAAAFGDHGLCFKTSFALVPVGLREALVTLGDGEVSGEQGARVLSFLSEAASRFGRERGLSVGVTPYFGARAAIEFAASDARHFRFVQPNLFDWESELGAPRGVLRERGRPYSKGFDLGREERALELETALAILCASSGSGTLHAPQWLEGAAGAREHEGTPCLDAWLRIDRARERLRQRTPRLFALPNVAANVRAVPTLPFALESQSSDAVASDRGDPDPGDFDEHHASRAASRAQASVTSLRLSPDTPEPHEPCV